jgi:Avidin family
MKLLRYLVAAMILMTIVILPLASGTELEGTLSAQSIWTNAEGSILFIDKIDESTKKITGHYINKAEGYPCQGTPYPLTGWVFGGNITFSVKWQNETESCQALTTWIGFIEDNKIITSWQFVNQTMHELSEIVKGEDDFELTQ